MSYHPHNPKTFAYFLFLYLVAFIVAPPASAQREEEVDLERLQEKIQELERTVSTDIAKRDKAVGELREAEIEVASVTAKIRQIESDRRSGEKRLSALNREREDEELQIARQRDVLAGQIRAAYINGREERLKLLLNQQDPATLGRLMVYYGYLSRSRAESIQIVRGHVGRLIALAEATVEESNRLKELAQSSRQRLGELQKARSRRSELIATLDKKIRNRSDEINRLQEEERTLTALIDDLRRVLKEFPVDANEPFERLRGKLAWPVKGSLLKDFGQPRAEGRLKWNGVLVASPRGAPVRALYHGRVAFADWLPGMGLLLVIEHGNGFMSLYGHNETLLKAVGDWVAPGDVIASVGDSGGRPEPALYFEIRRGKQHLNPHRWIGTRLSSR